MKYAVKKDTNTSGISAKKHQQYLAAVYPIEIIDEDWPYYIEFSPDYMME